MYAYIKGKLITKLPTSVVLEAGNLAYEIRVSLTASQEMKINELYTLHTHYQVTENAHYLYGFLQARERDFFRLLVSVSGVGPSTGLLFFSSMTLAQLQQAIFQRDLIKIQSVRGIGKKTAERVILELKNKIDNFVEDGDLNTVPNPELEKYQEALLALTHLGIPKTSAEKKLKGILQKSDNELTVEELIKTALQTS